LGEMARLARKQENLLRTLSQTLHTSDMHPDLSPPLPSPPSRTSRESPQSSSNIDQLRAKQIDTSTSIPIRAKLDLYTSDHHAPRGASPLVLSLPPLITPEQSASAATRARWSRLLDDAKAAASPSSSSRHAPSPSASRLSPGVPILPRKSTIDLSRKRRFDRTQDRESLDASVCSNFICLNRVQ
jgi:hypothetical protein